MKKYLILILSLISLSALAQQGSLSQSVYRSRVNDSTTVNGATSQGYGYFFWNNQKAVPSWQFWNGTSLVDWNPSNSGSGSLTDGNGTTANGTAVDLGGTVSSTRTFTGSGNFTWGSTGTPYAGFINMIADDASGGLSVNTRSGGSLYHSLLLGTTGFSAAVRDGTSGFQRTSLSLSTSGNAILKGNTDVYLAPFNESVNLLLHNTNGIIMNLGSDAAGDIYYRSSGGNIARLPVGSNDNVLTLSSGLPAWSSITKTGTLISGSTGAGFTVALGTSTITGALPVANLTAKYILDTATPSTAGGTITLDMNSQIQRIHVGSASFSTPKTIALSNTTNALVFDFHFEITDVAAVLTMPSDFILTGDEWDGSDWTALEAGQYEMGGTFDGTNWKVKIAGPFN